MNKYFYICGFFVAAASRVLAQNATDLSPPAPPAGFNQPAGYVAHNVASKSNRPTQTSLAPANTALQQSDRTKVLRIYGGPGYFDNTLAYKIRPALFAAFPFAKPEPAKPIPGVPKTSPAKVEGQTKMMGKPQL